VIAEQVRLKIVRFRDGSQSLNRGMQDQHRDRNGPIMSACTTLVGRRSRRRTRWHRVVTPSRFLGCRGRKFQGPHCRNCRQNREEQQHRSQA